MPPKFRCCEIYYTYVKSTYSEDMGGGILPEASLRVFIDTCFITGYHRKYKPRFSRLHVLIQTGFKTFSHLIYAFFYIASYTITFTDYLKVLHIHVSTIPYTPRHQIFSMIKSSRDPVRFRLLQLYICFHRDTDEAT